MEDLEGCWGRGCGGGVHGTWMHVNYKDFEIKKKKLKKKKKKRKKINKKIKKELYAEFWSSALSKLFSFAKNIFSVNVRCVELQFKYLRLFKCLT